jgi:hypothetical protein
MIFETTGFVVDSHHLQLDEPLELEVGTRVRITIRVLETLESDLPPSDSTDQVGA